MDDITDYHSFRHGRPGGGVSAFYRRACNSKNSLLVPMRLSLVLSKYMLMILHIEF